MFDATAEAFRRSEPHYRSSDGPVVNINGPGAGSQSGGPLPTSTASTTASSVDSNSPSQTPSSKSTSEALNSSSSNNTRGKGLPTGAIAGIAVAIVVLAILLVVGVLLLLRRRRRNIKSPGGDQPEDGIMMAEAKQVDADDGSGSAVLHNPRGQHASQPVTPAMMPPQLHQDQPLQLQHPNLLVGNVGSTSSIHYQPTPVAVPSTQRISIDQDLIGRPVSPPLADETATAGPSHSSNVHASTRDLVELSRTGNGKDTSPLSGEDDPEMQWILEEERRARERREQQEELRRLR